MCVYTCAILVAMCFQRYCPCCKKGKIFSENLLIPVGVENTHWLILHQLTGDVWQRSSVLILILTMIMIIMIIMMFHL